ncbi:DNA phosphorothioation-dependent restriction protein DptG [Metabacillus sp. B2-18]|uniref:DNA phosphorothioation-dependent restriction protein DptG n=1 Tax=Metabacillus sp. B2-18 TaxID=2897333 RepID=UPI001E291F6B|nr:DNA phosphorothioation-dependent restriction protein DptG [Metabacillus sp. B2-18]UGB33147.1 DNA phosphorothioation-dependent restriction protein DptG [Metabacillus sp. B2-18]
MEKVLNVEYLEDLLKKKNKHDVGQTMDVIPFLSKRTRVIREHFNDTLGEYIRRICDLKLNKVKKDPDALFEEDNPFIEQIVSEVECENSDIEYDLKRFIEQYLYNKEKRINPIHPFLFNYIPFSNSSNENELRKYAQFMMDVFVQDHNDIKQIFNDKSGDDILTELIIDNLEDLKSESYTKQYKPLLPCLTQLYQEDLIFLSHHKDYFLKTFSLLTHFYTFIYACQLVLKFDRFDKADYSKVDPLFFGLEWESLNKRRKPADELEGFKRVREKESNLFVHIHTMSQLSHNTFNPENSFGKLPFMNYVQLNEYVQDSSEQVFLTSLKNWIATYCEWRGLENKDNSSTISEAFQILFNCLKEGMSTEVCIKFGQNIEDLGANLFLKNRGSLGPILNLNHESLLMLTAVCVKDKRIPLNQLFDEFELRGVIFDRYSKKEIIDLLDSQNLIDKKSDSGDAQYVKPIL